MIRGMDRGGPSERLIALADRVFIHRRDASLHQAI